MECEMAAYRVPKANKDKDGMVAVEVSRLPAA